MEREGSGVSSEVLCSVLMELCEYQQREIARLLLLVDGSQDADQFDVRADVETVLELDRLTRSIDRLTRSAQRWVRVQRALGALDEEGV